MRLSVSRRKVTAEFGNLSSHPNLCGVTFPVLDRIRHYLASDFSLSEMISRSAVAIVMIIERTVVVLFIIQYI